MARRIPTYAELRDDYIRLWHAMETRPERKGTVDLTVRKIAQNKSRYQAVEGRTGVPWYVVGIIHSLETGLRFDRHLHNGDPLSARTVHVPKGRPATGSAPWSFEDSAVDALKMQGLDKIERWDVARIAYALEAYNGWGYRLFHPDTPSPYLWSFSGYYRAGKYVADGSFSPSAISEQAGAMVLLKAIAAFEPSIDLEIDAPDPASDFVRTPTLSATPPAGMAQSTTGNSAVGIGAGSTVLVANEISSAATKAAEGGFSIGAFALALAQSPTFWVGAINLALAAYIWLERRRKLTVNGV